MKTLLRHTRTGLYFKGPERWTDDPQQAFDFRFIDRALNYMSTWELKDAEPAFAYESSVTLSLVTMPQAVSHDAAAAAA